MLFAAWQYNLSWFKSGCWYLAINLGPTLQLAIGVSQVDLPLRLLRGSLHLRNGTARIADNSIPSFLVSITTLGLTDASLLPVCLTDPMSSTVLVKCLRLSTYEILDPICLSRVILFFHRLESPKFVDDRPSHPKSTSPGDIVVVVVID